MWNRLGSSLSNGSKPEEALGAYREALRLRPTYTRAIYNVGVACVYHPVNRCILVSLTFVCRSEHRRSQGSSRAFPQCTYIAESRFSGTWWSTDYGASEKRRPDMAKPQAYA